MKFRVQKTEDIDLNLTPLIDVVFLLLIFFMVSTTFQKESELSVHLPEASQKPVTVDDNALEIAISASGQFFVNGQELTNSHLRTLRKAIKTIVAGKRDIPVVIRADAQTPHQSVVTAMDAAGQLGMRHLSIATTNSNSK